MAHGHDPPGEQNVFEARGLKKYFPVRRGLLQRAQGWIKAVDDIDFRIPEEKTLGLVGESG